MNEYIIQLLIGLAVPLITFLVKKLYEIFKKYSFKILFIVSYILLLSICSNNVLTLIKELLNTNFCFKYCFGIFTLSLTFFDITILSFNLCNYLFNNFNNKQSR